MFSIYKNTYDIESAGELELKTVYELITLKCRLSAVADFGKGTDLWPYHVKNYRQFGTKRIKETLLPAVIFYATTAEHDRKILKVPSGYFCIDLDSSDNKKMFYDKGLDAVKTLIAESFSSTALIFTSPSGKGLKVVHKIRPEGSNSNEHIWVANKVFEHYLSRYSLLSLNIDHKCKDWNRLCYLSYDREAYYNENAAPETILIPEVVVLPLPVLKDEENGYKLSGDRRDKDQICPKCGGGRHRDKSFTYYVDQNGNRLDGCGVCSRSKCNANIKPWEEYPNVKWKYLGKRRS